MTARPEWKHKTPEALARFILAGVRRIETTWQPTNVGIERWLVLACEDQGYGMRKVPTSFFEEGEWMFSPATRSLVVEARDRAPIKASIQELDAWDREQKRAA